MIVHIPQEPHTSFQASSPQKVARDVNQCYIQKFCRKKEGGVEAQEYNQGLIYSFGEEGMQLHICL